MPIDPQFTFARALNELILRMGRRNDNDFTQRATDWLQSAQYRIASSYVDLPDLEDELDLPLTEDVAEYDLRTTSPPITDIVGIRWIKNTHTGYMLRRFPYTEYQQLVHQATGDPMRWCRNGYVLAFDPKPATGVNYDVTIKFRRMPQYGQFEIGDDYQDAAIKLASAIGWSALMEHQRAQAVQAELPPVLQFLVSGQLSQSQWEAMVDPDLGVRPLSYGY